MLWKLLGVQSLLDQLFDDRWFCFQWIEPEGPRDEEPVTATSV